MTTSPRVSSSARASVLRSAARHAVTWWAARADCSEWRGRRECAALLALVGGLVSVEPAYSVPQSGTADRSASAAPANWTRGYPPRLSRVDVAVCGWVHRWPVAALDAVSDVQATTGDAIDREFREDLQGIESRLHAALGEGADADPLAQAEARADAFRDRETLADRVLARESQLLAETLVARGISDDDVFLVTSTLSEHRRSVLGQQCAPPLAGAGDRDIRPILLRIAQSATDPDERRRLDEFASEALPNLESLFKERRRMARRVVPQSTVLFARMRASPSSDARQALRGEREALRGPLAGIERRIVESSLLVMQRFRETASGELGERARREILEEFFGPVARDPWDPAELVALARELESADATRVGLAAAVSELAGAQQPEREERHRAAQAAVIRFWHDFGRSMTVGQDDTARLLAALARWHAASRALGESVAVVIERDAPPGADDPVRTRVAQWRERAEATEESQRKGFVFARTPGPAAPPPSRTTR